MEPFDSPAAEFGMTVDQARNAHNFTHHPPPDDKHIAFYQSTRRGLCEQADRLCETLPNCRERAVAITKLEEAMFWANAAAARNGLA